MPHLVQDYQVLSYCDWKEQLATLFQDGFISSLTVPTDLSYQELQPCHPFHAAMNVVLVYCDVWCLMLMGFCSEFAEEYCKDVLLITFYIPRTIAKVILQYNISGMVYYAGHPIT